MASAFGVTATNFTAQDVNELIKQAGMSLQSTSFLLLIRFSSRLDV